MRSVSTERMPDRQRETERKTERERQRQRQRERDSERQREGQREKTVVQLQERLDGADANGGCNAGRRFVVLRNVDLTMLIHKLQPARPTDTASVSKTKSGLRVEG